MTEDLEDLSDRRLRELREKPSVFVQEIIGVDPFDYQTDVLDSGSDRIAFVSGRQVGKSRTASWYALHFALTNPESTVLITAPTQNQSSELFKQVRKEMRMSKISDEQWGADRTTRTEIEFNNSSRILCRTTGDTGDNIRGLTTDLIVVDEAAFIDDEIYFQALLPMLATTDGSLVLLSTPFGARGFLYEAFTGGLEEEYYTMQVPTYRNPKVSDDYIANQQQQLPSIEFKQEILGKFVESANAFFQADLIEECMKGPIKKNHKSSFLGVDLARHGEDKSVFISVDGNGNVYSIETDSDSPLTEAIGRVKNLHEEYQFDRIYIDETALGGGVVDILKQDLRGRTVEGITFTNKKKQSLYNTLKSKMEEGVVNLPQHSELQKELLDLEYSFTSGGKMKIEHPEGGHDDYADALALAVWGLKNGNRVRQSGSKTMDPAHEY